MQATLTLEATFCSQFFEYSIVLFFLNLLLCIFERDFGPLSNWEEPRCADLVAQVEKQDKDLIEPRRGLGPTALLGLFSNFRQNENENENESGRTQLS